MSTLPKSRLRIAGDLFRFNRLVDLLRPSQTNQFEEETPLVPRFHGADALQIEVAIFNDGVLLNNLSAITELELVIKPLRMADSAQTDSGSANPDALRGPASNVAPIVCKRIGSDHFNAALSDSQWQSKAANMAHAIITLDSEEAALAPGERWLSLIALGADGQARTLAAGPVLVLGGGPTFNALPQPVVKDLRDQAAQSATQARHSAEAAAASAQHSANAALAAQEQTGIAETAAAQAEAARLNAQQAEATTGEAREQAQHFSNNAQAAAHDAQQTAAQIGDLDDALTQAHADAERSQTAAVQSEASRLAAAAYAAALNPLNKITAGGVNKDATASITLDNPVLLGASDFDIWVVASNVPRSDSAADTLLAFAVSGIPLIEMVRSSGLWRIRNAADTVVLSATRKVTDTAIVRLCRQDGTLSLSINGEPAAQVSGLTATDFGAVGHIGSRNTAGDAFGWHGTLRNLAVFNRALNTDEAADMLAGNGQIIPASTRPPLPAGELVYQSDFSTTQDGWSAVATAGLTYTAGATVGGQSSAWLWSGNGTGSSNAFSQRNIIPNNNADWDGLYAVELSLYIPAANTKVTGIKFGHPNGDLYPLTDFINVPRNQWVKVGAVFNGRGSGSVHNSFIYMADSNGGYVNGADNSGEQIALKDIRVTRLGCVLDLPMEDGAGYQLRDNSGNANRALLSATGCRHVKYARDFEFSWSRVSSGFLGDADRPALPEGAVIESVIWEDTKTTRTTASLGFNAGNSATHVASFTPVHSRQSVTLSAGSMTATDRRLYLNMSSNAGAVTVRVRGRIL